MYTSAGHMHPSQANNPSQSLTSHAHTSAVHAYFLPFVYSVNRFVNIASQDFCLGAPQHRRVMHFPICN